MNSVSVIIPTYNSWLTLKACIASLYKQSLKPVEIVVVDNASTDQTSKFVKKTFPKVKLVSLKINTGVAGGRNTGLSHARKTSRYYFFFDHDMVAHPQMLAKLVEVAKSEKTIGIVTPKIYYLQSKRRIWSAGTGINLLTGQVLFRGGQDVGQYQKIEQVQVAPAALLVKSEAIRKVKKFATKYFAVYEDTDFCFRAQKHGFKTMYTPHAVAYHDLSTDPAREAQRLLTRGYLVGRNRIWFMRDFSQTFWAFSLLVPIYLVYYLTLAIKYRNISGWLRLVHGTVDGFLKHA